MPQVLEAGPIQRRAPRRRSLFGGWRRRFRVLAEIWRLRRGGRPEAKQLGHALMRASFSLLRRDERKVIGLIESERRRVESSDQQVSWKNGELAWVSMIARRTSVPRKEGILLLTLVRAFAPSRGLELGTSIGVSAAYQASAMRLNGTGKLVSLEGYRDLVEQARELWARIGLDNVTAVIGRFDKSLPRVLADGALDYAFIDGNHQEAATIVYFDEISARANPGALLVFDDINWSPGMQRAWRWICDDARVAVHAVAGRFGMVILSGGPLRPPRPTPAAPGPATRPTEP